MLSESLNLKNVDDGERWVGASSAALRKFTAVCFRRLSLVSLVYATRHSLSSSLPARCPPPEALQTQTSRVARQSSGPCRPHATTACECPLSLSPNATHTSRRSYDPPTKSRAEYEESLRRQGIDPHSPLGQKVVEIRLSAPRRTERDVELELMEDDTPARLLM